MTVYLIDDDPSVRRGIGRLLRSAGHEVRSFALAEPLLDQRERLRGCVLLDLDLTASSGLDVQRALASSQPTLPVVFLTGRGTVASGVTAMKAGAVDFLEKPVERERLLAAIEQALAEERRRVAEHEERHEADALVARLTEREREVFGLVARGLQNAEIARVLGIATATAKLHRSRVMKKLEASSVAELVGLHATLERG